VGSTGPYQYALNGGAFQNSNIFTGLASGNYTVVLSDAVGCSSSQLSVTVSPGQPLTATIVTTAALCNGGSTGTATVTLSNNGTPPYQYSLDNITFQASNNFTGLAAGNYTVYFRDQNSCSGTQSFVVTQPAALVMTSTGRAVLCNGQSNGLITSTVAGGTGPYQYSINGGAYQVSDSFQVAEGTYTIRVRDANGCIAIRTVDVTQPALLTATAVATPATCAGNDGTVTVTATGGTAPYQYSSDGVNFQPSNSFALAAGTYTIVIRDANNCSFSIPGRTVGQMNTLSFTPMTDTTICEGQSVTLNPVGNPTQFSWQSATSLSATNIRNPVATPSQTTSYIVTLGLGVCAANDTIQISVLPAPIANAGANATICFGQDFTLQGSGGVSYQWSPATYLSNANAATPTSTRPRESMQYSLTVTDANGCRSLQPDVMQLTVTPPIRVTINKDTVVSMNDSLRLFASSVATSYVWSPAFGLSNPNIANPLATIVQDVTYLVTATTAAGCQGEARVTIKVFDGPEIYVPTAFTPNGDGLNDVFRPFPVGIRKLNFFRVYNRWGQLIYSTSTLNQGWNGRMGSEEAPTGSYVWVAEGVTKEGKVIAKKGVVTLIR
jgi:gliding motility-associated-like protein